MRVPWVWCILCIQPVFSPPRIHIRIQSFILVLISLVFLSSLLNLVKPGGYFSLSLCPWAILGSVLRACDLMVVRGPLMSTPVDLNCGLQDARQMPWLYYLTSMSPLSPLLTSFIIFWASSRIRNRRVLGSYVPPSACLIVGTSQKSISCVSPAQGS